MKALSPKYDDILTNLINNHIIKQLQNQKSRTLLNIMNYFSNSASFTINEHIKNYTIEAIKLSIDKMTANDIDELINSKCEEMSKLSNDILNKKWPVEENDISIFNFIFEHNHFLKVYFFIEHTNASEDYQQKELKIISLVESTLKYLTGGSINISLLKMLNEKRPILIDLFKLFSERIDFKPWSNVEQIDQVINKIFDYRMMEIDSYAKFHKFMEEFFIFMKNQRSYHKSIYSFNY